MRRKQVEVNRSDPSVSLANVVRDTISNGSLTGQAPVTERRCRAPATNRRRAVNVLLYPLHLCRKFERRWSAKVIRDGGQPLSSPGADGCAACGRLVMGPVHSTYLPTGKFVNQWRCPVCR